MNVIRQFERFPALTASRRTNCLVVPREHGRAAPCILSGASSRGPWTPAFSYVRLFRCRSARGRSESARRWAPSRSASSSPSRGVCSAFRLLVGMLACLGPTLRGLRIQPVEAAEGGVGGVRYGNAGSPPRRCAPGTRGSRQSPRSRRARLPTPFEYRGLAPLPVGDHLQTRHPTELRGVRRNKGEFVLQAPCGDPQVVRADERAPLP